MVFRVLFYLKYISNQDGMLQEEAVTRLLLEEIKLNISK